MIQVIQVIKRVTFTGVFMVHLPLTLPRPEGAQHRGDGALLPEKI